MDIVYESSTLEEFTNKWQNMVQDFDLNSKEWFQTLYDNREKWMSMFVKDHFWARMSST